MDNNFLTLKNAVNDLNTYGNYFIDTGSANTIIITLAANMTGPLTDGLLVQVKVVAANTGATTLNYNAGGALNVLDLSGHVLPGGALLAGSMAQFQYRASDTSWIVQTPFIAPNVVGKAIYGLTYDNGTDAVNSININVGGAMDITGAYWMRVVTALGKQSHVAWAVGGTTAAPAGGLDTGAVGNSDYYIWLIARPDTGVVDALFSLSSTAPTMPANYTFKRLIGWFKRVGATIVAFHTYETEGSGLEMNWDVPTLDVNQTNTLTTSRRTDAVKVPLNFSVLAHLNVVLSDSVVGYQVIICCPDQTDAAPSLSVAPLTNINAPSAFAVSQQMLIRTSAAGLIAARSTIATVDSYNVATVGFTWERRN